MPVTIRRVAQEVVNTDFYDFALAKLEKSFIIGMKSSSSDKFQIDATEFADLPEYLQQIADEYIAAHPDHEIIVDLAAKSD